MKYTVRSLMEKVNMTYTNTYSVIRRMREKGLVQDVKKTNGVGMMNAKQYNLLMDPVEFLNKERQKNPPPPEGFFNNPFNLKGAKDARYNS
jgi:predicted transcriptional regulator